MSRAEENRKIIEDVYRAIFSGDLEGFMSHCTEDVALIEADSLPYGGVSRGREQVEATSRRIFTVWQNLVFDIDDYLVSDTRVAAVGTFRATAAATGKPVTFALCELWTLDNGKVVSCQPIYGDTHLALAALG